MAKPFLWAFTRWRRWVQKLEWENVDGYKNITGVVRRQSEKDQLLSPEGVSCLHLKDSPLRCWTLPPPDVSRHLEQTNGAFLNQVSSKLFRKCSISWTWMSPLLIHTHFGLILKSCYQYNVRLMWKNRKRFLAFRKSLTTPGLSEILMLLHLLQVFIWFHNQMFQPNSFSNLCYFVKFLIQIFWNTKIDFIPLMPNF